MHYDKAFKEEAVCLSNEIGIKKASEQLGISYNTLAGWRRSKARYGENAYIGSGNRHKPTNAKEQRILDLEKENRELKRANDDPQGCSRFFRREPKEVRAHERYRFIHSRRETWPVKILCETLEVSESGYYRFVKNLGKPVRMRLFRSGHQKHP